MPKAIILMLIAWGSCLLLTPCVRDLFFRLNLIDRPDGGRKFHNRAVPRLGGIGVMLAFTATILAAMLPYAGNVEEARLYPSWLASILLPAAVIFATGLFDDLVGLGARPKLALQTAAAVLACLNGVRFGASQPDPIALTFTIVLSIIWLLACTNAFNLIDGLDGLAAGVGILMAGTMAIAGLLHHDSGLAVASMLLAGALLGFLRYNFNPASIFLGDSGSLTIGFVLGCCSIVWSNHQDTAIGKLAPIVVFAVPLLDLALSVLRRSLRGVPIFTADRGHIHHRLLARGFSARRSVVVLYIGTVLSSAVAITVSESTFSIALIALLLFATALLGCVHQLRYAEFGAIGSAYHHFSWRRMLSTHITLTNFKQALATTVESEDYWKLLREACREFGFSQLSLVLNGRRYEEELRLKSQEPQWEMVLPLSDTNSLVLSRDIVYGTCAESLLSFLEVVQSDLMRRQDDRRFTFEPLPNQSMNGRSFAAR